MALTAALVDRARIISKQAAGRRVEGQTLYGAIEGPWFKARLTVSQTPEAIDVAAGVRVAVKTPSLLCGVRDSEGNDIELNLEDRLEIDSKELGALVYDVVGDPEPLRKKRRVIGWQAPLRRVIVHGQDTT